MEHFIIDYETMSQNPLKCALVNSAYFVFETDRFLSDNPYTHKELTSSIKRDKFNVSDQKSKGYDVDPETVNWWMQQEEHVRKQCFPTKDDITRLGHMSNVKSYLKGRKISRWWSRGNTFDPVILKILDDEAGTDIFKILHHWNVRDTRTFIDTKFGFSTRTDFSPFEDEKEWNRVFLKHNSIHDVSADILRMQAVARAENDLQLVNE